jgi:hypothetical protein
MIGKIIGIVFLLVVVYFAWDFMFVGSDGEENMIQNLQKNSPLSDNPAKQYDNSVSSRDIVLSRENPNIPSSAWNP